MTNIQMSPEIKKNLNVLYDENCGSFNQDNAEKSAYGVFVWLPYFCIFFDCFEKVHPLLPYILIQRD